MSRGNSVGYTSLSHNDYNDVLLDDYDGSEEQLISDVEEYEDADEL
jgi:hypothetical protein